MQRSPRVRDSGIREIFVYRIRNTAQGIWNPTNDWNPTLKSGIQVPLTKTGNKYTTAWNPRQPYMGQQRVPKRSGLGHHNVLSEIAVLMFGTPTS